MNSSKFEASPQKKPRITEAPATSLQRRLTGEHKPWTVSQEGHSFYEPRFGHDFSRVSVQTKTVINQPGDEFEQEAERVAQQVTTASSLWQARPEAGSSQAPLIQRQNIFPATPVTEGDEVGSLQPANAPKWAVPLERRVTFVKKTGRFKDSATGKNFSRSEMDRYRKQAEDHEYCYSELVKRLTARRPQVKPSDNISEIILKEFNDIGKCGTGSVGGTAPPASSHGACVIDLQPDPNPFLILPFWLHESRHQQTCVGVYNAKLREYKKSGFYTTAGRRAAIIKEALESKTEKAVTEPAFLLDDEIRSYKETAEAIREELEGFKTIEKQDRGTSSQKKKLQRMSLESEPELQTDDSFTPPSIVSEVLQSPGQPLDAETRAFFEPRFGHDFSMVRVHTDAKAAESARAVNARAYTAALHISFGNGMYSPGTFSGRQLLAHELAHVVQQSGGTNGQLRLVSTGRDGAEQEAVRASQNLTTGRVQVQKQQPVGIARAEPHIYQSASTEVIDVEGSVAAIEKWQQGLAGSVADSNIVVKISAFVPFFFLELLRRTVQLGNLLFGVTELQHAADVIFEPAKSLGERIKAGLWALFTIVMSLLMVEGIMTKAGQVVGRALEAGGRLGWVMALRGHALDFLQRISGLVRRNLPALIESLESFGRYGRRLFAGLINKVTGSEIWARMVRWSQKRVPLPRAIEALSDDLGKTLRGLFEKEAEKVAPPVQSVGQAADEMSWWNNPPADRAGPQSRTIPIDETETTAEILPTRYTTAGDVPITPMDDVERFTPTGPVTSARMRGLQPTAYSSPKRVEITPVKVQPTAHKPVRKVGGRKVTREEQLTGVPSRKDWENIRRGTPTDGHRARAQRELPIGAPDPAFPGQKITQPAQPDHIIPVDYIRKMPGFAALGEPAQMIVLNMEDNFVALSAKANQSKGGRTFSEWLSSKSGLAKEVDQAFGEAMIAREKELFKLIQQKIDELLKRQMMAARPEQAGTRARRVLGPTIGTGLESGQE